MRTALSLVIASVGLLACGGDAEVSDAVAPSEHGRWAVAMATRNGRVTHTMDVAYFEFDTARAKLSTNFVGEELNLDYVREGNTILTPGNVWFKLMEIRALTDSTLVLASQVTSAFVTFDLVPDTSAGMNGLAPVRVEEVSTYPEDDDPREG